MGYHGRAVEWIKVQLGWTVRRSLNACRSGGATPSTANRPQCLGGQQCRGGGSSGALSLGSDATAGWARTASTGPRRAFIYAATVRLMLGRLARTSV